MVKYIKLIIVFILCFTLFNSIFLCNPVFSSNDQTVLSKSEYQKIETLLKKYNDFVLIKYLCKGAFEYDDSVLYYTAINELYEWTEDDGSPNGVKKDKIYRFRYRVTDQRYSSLNDVSALIYSIFEKKEADEEFDYFFRGGSITPIFADDGEHLYFNKELNDNALIRMRYIDTDTLDIAKENGKYFVTAKGASVYKNGAIQENDSIIKFVISSSFLIEEIYTSKINAQEFTFSSHDEVIVYLINELNKLPNEGFESDNSIEYITTFNFSNKRYGRIRVNKLVDESITSTADIYDKCLSVFSYNSSDKRFMTDTFFKVWDDVGDQRIPPRYLDVVGIGVYNAQSFVYDKPFYDTKVYSYEIKNDLIIVKLPSSREDEEHIITIKNCFTSADPEYRITNIETVHK